MGVFSSVRGVKRSPASAEENPVACEVGMRNGFSLPSAVTRTLAMVQSLPSIMDWCARWIRDALRIKAWRKPAAPTPLAHGVAPWRSTFQPFRFPSVRTTCQPASQAMSKERERRTEKPSASMSASSLMAGR